MTTFKHRLSELEDEVHLMRLRELGAYLHGRSEPDVDFFCIHGYLPDTPLVGPVYDASRLINVTREAHERMVCELEGLTPEEMENFARSGKWLDQDGSTSGH